MITFAVGNISQTSEAHSFVPKSIRLSTGVEIIPCGPKISHYLSRKMDGVFASLDTS